jgi:BirA family transcriptional regulator, biotin operon repressor / biotin---[acetyl-CoA-carboxylase] ligase
VSDFSFTEFDHIHLDEVDSTNTWAKRKASFFNVKKLTLITAEKQSDGKGRQGRKWFSPSGENIYATLVFRLPESLHSPGALTQVLAITTARLLEKEGFSPYIKWPNDLFLNKKKVAGILAETLLLNNAPGIAMGIGLNVNMPASDLTFIDQEATSLFIESGQHKNSCELAKKMTFHFLENLKTFFSEGTGAFHSDLERYNLFRKKPVLLKDGRNIWKGDFSSLNLDGSIQLKLESGEYKTFYSGELIHSNLTTHL